MFPPAGIQRLFPIAVHPYLQMRQHPELAQDGNEEVENVDKEAAALMQVPCPAYTNAGQRQEKTGIRAKKNTSARMPHPTLCGTAARCHTGSVHKSGQILWILVISILAAVGEIVFNYLLNRYLTHRADQSMRP